MIGITALLFIDNKYTHIYYNIIIKAQSRVLEDNIYSEKHHIIPKSLGGNNRNDNLVRLTAREHFIAHWLLTKMVNSKKQQWQMWIAFQCMLYRENDTQQRYKITGRIFENIKQKSSVIRSQRFSGENNPMFGKKHSVESKQKISDKRGNIGRPHTEEAKVKISQAISGIVRSAEHKAMISKVHKGKIESAETKLKKSLSHIGKRWINDGHTSKWSREDVPPDGWVFGRLHWRK